jgi:hypothetical protein
MRCGLSSWLVCSLCGLLTWVNTRRERAKRPYVTVVQLRGKGGRMTGRRLPSAHLSIRVPWHDSSWDGTICARPLDNSACLALRRVGQQRDDAFEVAVAGRRMDELDPAARLPCVAEHAAFMAPFELTRTVTHPYSFSPAHQHFRSRSARSIRRWSTGWQPMRRSSGHEPRPRQTPSPHERRAGGARRRLATNRSGWRRPTGPAQAPAPSWPVPRARRHSRPQAHQRTAAVGPLRNRGQRADDPRLDRPARRTPTVSWSEHSDR